MTMYDQILNGCGEIGRRLLEAGAEIYRVEDTVRRIMAAYDVEGDVSAIPTVLMLSLTDKTGGNYARLYRVDTSAGANIEVIEKFNALSRSICETPPAPTHLEELVDATYQQCRTYSNRVMLFGYFAGAFFFTLFFQGGWVEAEVAGIAGIMAGICVTVLDCAKVNFFLRTILAASVLGITAYGFCAVGVPVNIEVCIIGALMDLVPGLVFTNFMCNLINGDAISGASFVVRALLTAVGMAIGVGIAFYLYQALGATVDGTAHVVTYSQRSQCVIAFFACLGFCFLYSVHGWGVILCCLGGTLGWGTYLVAGRIVDNMYLCYLIATILIAFYAEAMARMRKYPVTAYLVVSYFPLIPGSCIYYAMYYSLYGEWQLAIEKGVQAVGIAACLAFGTLLASSAVRTISSLCKYRRGQYHSSL